MDEESLFRDIHSHLIEQARVGEKMDTEMKLAERFNVSRYRVRQVLDMLTRMGVVRRSQKRGLTVLKPEPENLSKNISSQMTVSGFNAMEDLEARGLIEHSVLDLSLRRLTPMAVGKIADHVSNLERVSISAAAVIGFHEAFHFGILEGAGNRVLLVFADAMLKECMRLMRSHAESMPPEMLSDMIELDRDLLEAIRKGNAQAAHEALDKLIEFEVACAAKEFERD